MQPSLSCTLPHQQPLFTLQTYVACCEMLGMVLLTWDWLDNSLIILANVGSVMDVDHLTYWLSGRLHGPNKACIANGGQSCGRWKAFICDPAGSHKHCAGPVFVAISRVGYKVYNDGIPRNKLYAPIIFASTLHQRCDLHQRVLTEMPPKNQGLMPARRHCQGTWFWRSLRHSKLWLG